MANTLKLFCDGAVAFIEWLDLTCGSSLAYAQCPKAEYADKKREHATSAQLEKIELAIDVASKKSEACNHWMALVELNGKLPNAACPDCDGDA